MDSKGPAPVVATEQPQAPSMAYKSPAVAGTEEWQNDLFDCFKGDDNLCLKATFCSCFVYGKTVARSKDASLQSYESANNDCLAFLGLQACCGFGFVLAFMNRGEIRERYAIKGEPMMDCLTAYCCTCCSLIQVEKEVIARQRLQGDAGYVATPMPQMVAQPM